MDCLGLQANVYVCIDVLAEPISVSHTTTTATITSTTSSGGVVTPTPMQTGMVSGCISFYMVVSGVGPGS